MDFSSIISQFDRNMKEVYAMARENRPVSCEIESVVNTFKSKAMAEFMARYAERQAAKGRVYVSGMFDPEPFAMALLRILPYQFEIDIVGYWVYAKGEKTRDYKDELKALGYWYSVTHKAWVFSGGKKIRQRPKQGFTAYEEHEAETVERAA